MPASADTTWTTDAARGTRRVLVIDDSPLMRAASRLAISSQDGWEPLLAASGQEGIACAAREQPDAILLDIMMPDMDGFETARRLRSDPASSSIPIVLLSAQELAEGILTSIPGIAGLINKPFDVATLPGQLAALLGWSA